VVPSGFAVYDSVWFGAAGSESGSGTRGRGRSCSDHSPRVALSPAANPDSHPRVSFKRALDATLAFLGLIVLAPLLAVGGILIWLQADGPVLYGDEREGLGGRTFRCWKFRTMSSGANAVQRDLAGFDQVDGPHFKIKQDPRVTRLGAFLRASNIDELPQLIN